jgi:predicted ATP-grasp superfamily ATP-dependent carboligase
VEERSIDTQKLSSTPGGILVLGSQRQTLAVIRALGPLGLRIVVGQEGAQGLAFAARSRWVESVWRHPPIRANDAAFRAALEAFLLVNRDIRFVLPIGDLEIEWFQRAQMRLPHGIHYLMLDGAALTACRDKSRLMDLARDLAIPVAGYRIVEDPARLLDAVDQVGYPCVVKPESEATRIFGAKAYIVRDRSGLAAAIERYGLPRQRLIVQGYVEGHRHNLYFFAEHGRVRAAVQVRVIRTDRSDGTGYAVYGVTTPLSAAWLRHTERLIESLNYEGPGTLQFIDDPRSGQSCFLEINARLAGNHAVAEHFGLHVASWWIQHLQTGDANIPQPFSYRSGLRYGWFYGDLVGLQESRRRGECGGLQWPVRCARLLQTLAAGCHVTWNWRDPLPTVYLYGAWLKRLLSGAVGESPEHAPRAQPQH